MSIFPRRKKSPNQAPSEVPSGTQGAMSDEIVKDFLRGQNLEQIGRTEDAIQLYERAVAASFDAAGPYDRLIFIYEERRMLHDVIRVAEASMKSVKTYPEKRAWYETQIARAKESLKSPLKPR